METLALDPALLERKIVSWGARLQNEFRFDAEMARRDGSQARLSVPAAVASQGLEQYLGMVSAVRETLKVRGKPAGSQVERDELRDLFAHYAAASAMLAWLEPHHPVDVSLPSKQPIDLTCQDASAVNVVQCYLAGTRNAHSGAQLLGAAKDLFSLVVKEALQQKQKYVRLVQQLDDVHLRIGDAVIAGFTTKKYAPPVEIKPVSRDSYAGNTEFLAALTNIMTCVLDYDVKAKKNPSQFPQTVTVWGAGGMGKSTGIGIVLDETKQRAAKHGIPFLVKELRGFKSEYYGKSAQNIRDMFAEVNKGDETYAVIAEDIDTMFFSRSELHNRPEDKDVLGEFMNQLEGVAANGCGNYVLIATSNHPLSGDGALMARLRQCQIEVKGPQTPEEYGLVFRAQLREGISGGYVSPIDWKAIGRVAHEHRLSNRDVRNVCVDLDQNGRLLTRPDHFYTMPFEEKKAYLNRKHAEISEGTLRDAVLKYARGIERQRGVS